MTKWTDTCRLTHTHKYRKSGNFRVDKFSSFKFSRVLFTPPGEVGEIFQLFSYNYNLELTHVKFQYCAMLELTESFTWEEFAIRHFKSNADCVRRYTLLQYSHTYVCLRTLIVHGRKFSRIYSSPPKHLAKIFLWWNFPDIRYLGNWNLYK